MRVSRTTAPDQDGQPDAKGGRPVHISINKLHSAISIAL
jgi:hypothetical protein